MAIARCKSHGPPEGRTRSYDADPIQPVGYPLTAVVCGIRGCEEPALVWLDTQSTTIMFAGNASFVSQALPQKLRVE
jgi:hypothetical protein